MKKFIERLEPSTKAFLFCLALYIAIYIIADLVEIITW